MADVTVVYWRDIPAQVIVGRGRKAAKLPLPERFEQAIDRAAMTSGLAGTDDYLAQWRSPLRLRARMARSRRARPQSSTPNMTPNVSRRSSATGAMPLTIKDK